MDSDLGLVSDESCFPPLRDLMRRISRAIRSRVLLVFLNVMSTSGRGEAGRGLLRAESPVYMGTMVVGVGAIPLLVEGRSVEGRSPDAKLIPESARRSALRTSAISLRNTSTVTVKHSSMIALALRRYLSTISRTTGQPFSSCVRRLWFSRLVRTDLPFLATAWIYRKKALRCDARIVEVSCWVGGEGVEGGYRVFSIAMQLALLNGSRCISLIRVCRKFISIFGRKEAKAMSKKDLPIDEGRYRLECTALQLFALCLPFPSPNPLYLDVSY